MFTVNEYIHSFCLEN